MKTIFQQGFSAMRGPFLGSVALGQLERFGNTGPLWPPYQAAERTVRKFDTLKESTSSVNDLDFRQKMDEAAETYNALSAMLETKDPKDFEGSDWTSAEKDQIYALETYIYALIRLLPENMGVPVVNAAETVIEISNDLHDTRALDAAAFKTYSDAKQRMLEAKQSGNQAAADTANSEAQAAYAKVREYDSLILHLVTRGESLLRSLPESDLKDMADDWLHGRPDRYGQRMRPDWKWSYLKSKSLQGPRSLGQAAAVTCEATAEGGKVCSNGTYYPKGAAVPVLASEVPSQFPVVPVLAGVAVAGLAAWYFLRKK